MGRTRNITSWPLPNRYWKNKNGQRSSSRYGVAMLSSVLYSTRAVEVNIQIIRIFTKMRHVLSNNTEIRLEIEKIKGKLDNQDKNMEIVFRYAEKDTHWVQT